MKEKKPREQTKIMKHKGRLQNCFLCQRRYFASSLLSTEEGIHHFQTLFFTFLVMILKYSGKSKDSIHFSSGFFFFLNCMSVCQHQMHVAQCKNIICHLVCSNRWSLDWEESEAPIFLYIDR